jgi:class 3 adenylate cyclase
MCGSDEKDSQDIAEQREAVILFADLMNSSELANNWSLPDYDNFVAVFQEELGEVVEHFIQSKVAYQLNDNSALETDIRGDEICLKIYRATDKKSEEQRKILREDVASALQVAIQMKRKWLLCPSNQERIEAGRPIFDIGIGIHQGPVRLSRHYRFVPQTEGTISNKTTMPFFLAERITPEGHSINIAKRIETHSRELRFSQILVSHNVFNFVDPDFRVAFRRAEIGPLKGISQTIPVYEAIGIGHFDDQAFEPRFDSEELKTYEQAVTNNPDMIWLLLDLGHHYFDDEKYDKSAEKYQQVININPDFAPAHMYLGRCWFRRYRYEEAKHSLERALELNPLSPRANSFLAVCLRRLAYKYKFEGQEGWKDFFKRSLELHDRAKRMTATENSGEWNSAYLWALNGLSRTIAEAGKEARSHFSLDEAENLATEALNLVEQYRQITESRGRVIDKEHLVYDTLGYIYLKRCEDEECGKDDLKTLLSKAEETFKKAIGALDSRNKTAKMGEKNYHEKLSEIHFHLAVLNKVWGKIDRNKIKKANNEAELAMATAKKVDEKFLQDQYWYNEAKTISMIKPNKKMERMARPEA